MFFFKYFIQSKKLCIVGKCTKNTSLDVSSPLFVRFWYWNKKNPFLKEIQRLTNNWTTKLWGKTKKYKKNKFSMFCLIRRNFRSSQAVLKNWLFCHFVLFFVEQLLENSFTVYNTSIFLNKRNPFFTDQHIIFSLSSFFCYKIYWNNFFFT